ncbi:MAG: class I SAM-dependent methyltransferase [Planctomycetota bacterium]
MEQIELTDKEHWDSHWDRIKLPAEIKRGTDHPISEELVRIFDQHLPRRKNLSILEIGGAPGHYTAFFAKEFGYTIYALDYSEIGCAKLRENFDLLGLQGTIYHKDILTDDLSDLPRFDIVCSFGFIEHFEDFSFVVGKHVELLKGGGILIIGVPAFLGISRFVLGKISPVMLSGCNLEAMDSVKWESFEKRYGLETQVKAYIGGFQPRAYRRSEKRSFSNQVIRVFFKLIRILFTDRMKFLTKINSKYWSTYLVGIYRKV